MAEAARAELRRRLEPELAAAGFDLEDVAVSQAGSRSVVRVVVDRDGGIDLDAVADASRLVSAVLDGDGPGDVGSAPGSAGSGASGGPLAGAYVLEVTSPGVDRPLLAPRHWRRSVGRLVLVRRADGSEVEGRILSADEEGADLAVPAGAARRGRPPRTRLERVVYTAVARAIVQVEFGGSTADDSSEPAGEPAAGALPAGDADEGDSEDSGDDDSDDDGPDDDSDDDGPDDDSDDDGPDDDGPDDDGPDDDGPDDSGPDDGAPGAVDAGAAGEPGPVAGRTAGDHGAAAAEAGLASGNGKEMNR